VDGARPLAIPTTIPSCMELRGPECRLPGSVGDLRDCDSVISPRMWWSWPADGGMADIGLQHDAPFLASGRSGSRRSCWTMKCTGTPAARRAHDQQGAGLKMAPLGKKFERWTWSAWPSSPVCLCGDGRPEQPRRGEADQKGCPDRAEIGPTTSRLTRPATSSTPSRLISDGRREDVENDGNQFSEHLTTKPSTTWRRATGNKEYLRSRNGGGPSQA